VGWCGAGEVFGGAVEDTSCAESGGGVEEEWRRRRGSGEEGQGDVSGLGGNVV
jgi:hypothetical protein